MNTLRGLAFSLHRFVLGIRIVTALVVAALACAYPASAAPKYSPDPVDTAVEAFAIAGSTVGIAIGPTEKQLVAAIVRCAIENTAVLDCARKQAIAKLPGNIRPVAECAISGKRIELCPVSGSLTQQEQDLLSCILYRSDLRNCAALISGFNLSQSEVKKTLSLVARLKADQATELGQRGNGTIRNIIGVAEGIRDRDWTKVSVYGFAEVYKVAVKIVLNAVISAAGGGFFPGLAEVIDAVVNTVVQNRVDLVVNLIDAIEAKDKPRVGRLVLEFYLITHVEIPCSLFDALPEGSFTDKLREVTCGPLGDLIKAVGKAGSRVVAFADDKVAAFLRSFGIDPTGIFGKTCGTSANYYARNHATCTKHGAFLALINAPGAIRGSQKSRVVEVAEALSGLCRQHFHPCKERLIGGGTTEDITKVCRPLDGRFAQSVWDLANGAQSMAASYARENFQVSVSASEVRDCKSSAALQAFMPRCTRALSAQLPGLNVPGWQQCGARYPEWNLPRPDIFEAACSQAACSADTIKLASCRGYANSALDVRRRAHERQCDPRSISEPRWSPRYEDHFEWCMKAPTSARVNESNARENALFRCELVRKLPSQVVDGPGQTLPAPPPDPGDVTQPPSDLSQGRPGRGRGDVTQPPSDLSRLPGSGLPRGAIGDKYAKIGGFRSGIGPVLGGETDAPFGGRCQRFLHGSICWHPQIGEAFTVWGEIHKKWEQHRGVEYGYPITDELTTPDGRGRYNHFRGMQYPNRPESSIYWTPQTGAHAIYGAIRDAWAQQGWERGPLGYPTSDEHQDGKYRRVNFERGVIRWAPDTGIEIVR